jgi:hypothetical protein
MLHGGGVGAGGRAGGASMLRAQRRVVAAADVGGRWHRTSRSWRRRRGEERGAALGCEDVEAAQDDVDETVVERRCHASLPPRPHPRWRGSDDLPGSG